MKKIDYVWKNESILIIDNCSVVGIPRNGVVSQLDPVKFRTTMSVVRDKGISRKPFKHEVNAQSD